MTKPDDITAVILAGGRGQRMGGVDKGLVEFHGRPLIEHVIEAISQQVHSLLINANRNLVQYQRFGYPVIADSLNDYQGPLAGFLAAMEVAQTPDIVTVPCDGPLLANDLVARLSAARERDQAEIAVAHDGHRLQPVYALIPVALKQSLQAYLEGGDRKIDLWYARHRVATADFSDLPSTFVNINTEEERDRLQDGAA
ncbi:MAG: molybdenum cofactor guanylyltransferase MobA [Candidatus Thiodiazotropha sp.]|jgi:molybdenum cofactor guanylyltransferase